MNVGKPLVQVGLLGEAVDDAPVLVFVADEAGRYIAVSRHACDLLGYTRDELLSLTLSDVARYESAPEEFDAMVAQGVRPSEGEAILTRKDGSELRFRYRASQAQVAGMTLYVAVGFELPDP